ncbi:hypothetical protein BH09ACT12_BH09ACT12_00800 [soil metagenome]
MTDDSIPTSGAFHRLSTGECWQLLREQSVGRVACNVAGGPMVVPVNYVVDGDAIWVRTASYTELAVRLPGEEVSFQIDQIDLHRQRGWSVLARGRAEHVTHEQASAPPELLLAPPWPEGLRRTLFRIHVARLTGRAVGERIVDVDADRGPGSIQRRAVAGDPR